MKPPLHTPFAWVVWLGLLLPGSLWTQTTEVLYNEGASIYVHNGADLYLGGGLQNADRTSNTGQFYNAGQIHLTGDFSNLSSGNVFQATDPGTVFFEGGAIQTISGNTEPHFNNLTLAQPQTGGKVQLTIPARTDMTGTLDLGDDILDLQGNSFRILNSASSALARTSSTYTTILEGCVQATSPGFLKREVNAGGGAYLFPMAGSSRFRPVEIEPGASNEYAVRLNETTPPNLTMVSGDLAAVQPHWYYAMERTLPASNPLVVRYYADNVADVLCQQNGTGYLAIGSYNTTTTLWEEGGTVQETFSSTTALSEIEETTSSPTWSVREVALAKNCGNWTNCNLGPTVAINCTLTNCTSPLSSLGDMLRTQAITGATDYEYRFTAVDANGQPTGAVLSQQNGNAYTHFQPYRVAGIQYATRYSVQVRALVNGTWTCWGMAEIIETPGTIPTTGLRTSDCGTTINANLNTIIRCTPVYGAIDYKWELYAGSHTGTMTPFSRGNNNTAFNPVWYQSLSSGVRYFVKVRAVTPSGPPGPPDPSWTSCYMDMPNLPTTQLKSANCNPSRVYTSLKNRIYARTVAGATRYQFQFATPGTTFVYITTSDKMQLFEAPGVTYQTNYTVKVAAEVNGQWGLYGSACPVNTGPWLSTSLTPNYCGITINSLNKTIYCLEVPGATDYMYRFTDITGSTPISLPDRYRGTADRNFNVSLVPVMAGKTYEVQVYGVVDGQVSPVTASVCTLTVSAGASKTQETTLTAEEELDQGNSILVYPNPSDGGALYVKLESEVPKSGKTTFLLRDVLGRQLATKQLAQWSGEEEKLWELDTFKLSKGICFLTIIKDGVRETRKIVLLSK